MENNQGYDRDKMYEKVVTIYLEANPNPNSLKFVTNLMLVNGMEQYDFSDMENAAPCPLAQELFGYPFVERVFISGNFLTISKAENVAWEDIQDDLKAHITEYLQSGKELFNAEAQEQQASSAENETEIEGKIKMILDEYIRPAVESDGGAISFHSFENGVVKVLLQGACSGCPSSTITLKQGIENLLKHQIPEVQTVEAVGV
ncbi:NifU family protein [Persicobacter psychrovividus]|uniref:Iron transporter n=1 Tax=Persicobacter psychrovividus TaxID=387638 RepID=A0ABM7VBB1_9BACT|nr:iron transporter [Persicobacter psychrovividus]